jgi:shikimate kinase
MSDRNVAAGFSNLVLIGMPGAGKSTVGVLLAKLTARNFVDTDLLIQSAAGRPLQHIVDNDGYGALRQLEETVLLRLAVTNHVIATGGSAVYSERAMGHLKTDGLVIYLDVDLATLLTRLTDYATRGLAKRPDQDLADLLAERSALYQRYADLIIDCSGLNHEQVCERIIEQSATMVATRLIRGSYCNQHNPCSSEAPLSREDI